MRSAYRSLILTCIATLTISLLYTGLNIYTAIEIAKVAAGGIIGIVVNLLAVYIHGILGFLVSSVILARSFSRVSAPVNMTHSVGFTNIELTGVSKINHEVILIPLKIESETRFDTE